MRDTRDHHPSPLTAVSDRLQAALAGRYEIERELGRGGMAVVYLARDLKHHRHVAVKVLHPELTGALGGERFLREIGIAAQLQHPHILPLYDSGEVPAGPLGADGRAADAPRGLLYYVMPYVAGESLRDRLTRERQLPLDEALRIAREVADALAHAHAHGIVHRDIKPENILLSGEHALVADFGIAHAVSVAAGDAITLTGAAVGTPAYMSPEQATGGGVVDGRSDVYSLGCVVYEMLAGAPPFAGATPQVIVTRHLTDPPPPLRAVRPTVPARVEAAVLRALAKLPADRFLTAQLFADALRMTGEQAWVELGPTPPDSAPVATPPAGGTAWSAAARRPWQRALLAAATVVALVPLGVTLVDRLRHAAPPLDRSLYAVLPFEHRAGAAPPLLNGDQCERLMYEALARWRGVRLVDALLISDQRTQRGKHDLSFDDWIGIARKLGAGLVARGQVWQIARDTIYVRAVLYDVTNPRIAVRQHQVALAGDLSDRDRKFDELAKALLASPSAPGAAEGASGTRSLEAWLAYDRGLAAVRAWDLDSAERAFRTAVGHDPDYSQANLWLAQVIGWRSDAPPDEWAVIARRAVAGRRQLAPRDSALASALLALTNQQYDLACERYAALARDSTDFAAWYGLGECHRRDTRVLPDRSSPSGWRFRSSYHSAVEAYRRALQILPSVHVAFRGPAFRRLQVMLKAEANALRDGYAQVGGRLRVFGAYPSFAADTLAFVPYPIEDIVAAHPRTIPPTASAAVAYSRAILREIASTWVGAFPRSADANEALARVLEVTEVTDPRPGDAPALELVRRARTLSDNPEQRLRLAVADVRLLVKREDWAGAGRVADSLLAASPRPGPREAMHLAGLAALTGRVFRTADLLKVAAAVETPSRAGQPVAAPRPAAATARALLGYAALGAPPESIATLGRRVENLVRSYTEPERRQVVLDALLLQPLSLAYGELSPAVAHLVSPQADYLLAMHAARVRGRSAVVRAKFDTLRTVRQHKRPGDISIDAVYQEAGMLLALGDSAAALSWLSPSLDALPTLGTRLLDEVPQSAALVRAMVLRADLAARAGDRHTARRWARAVLALWSDADPPLRSQVNRMKALVASGPS